MTEKQGDEILEAASEKRKRGWPRVMAHHEAIIVNDCTEGDRITDRHQLNGHYRQRAVVILKDDPRFSWLVDYSARHSGKKTVRKPRILFELGRIENEEDMKAIALSICERKPKTKAAVTMIRRAQMRKGEVGSTEDLCDAFRQIIDDYLQSRPRPPEHVYLWAAVSEKHYSRNAWHV